MTSVTLDGSGIPHPVLEEDLLPNAYGSMPTAATAISTGQATPDASGPSVPGK